MWRKRNYHLNPKECPQTIQYHPLEIQHGTISFFHHQMENQEDKYIHAIFWGFGL